MNQPIKKHSTNAGQYATLSARKIGKVLTISEGVGRDIANTCMFMNNVQLQKSTAVAEEYSFDSSSLSKGEQGVTSEINVVFSLE